MKVQCIALEKPTALNKDGWLRVGQDYIVLEVFGAGEIVKFRVLSTSNGTPALHAAQQFSIIDPMIPRNWIFVSYPDNGWSIGPQLWEESGFWESYFNDENWARKLFLQELQVLEAEHDAGPSGF